MKQLNILGTALLGMLLSLPTLALMSDEEAQSAVAQAVQGGESPDAIIQMLRDDGRSLEQATVAAVQASTGESQISLARAGICAAEDVERAAVVGDDVVTVLDSAAVIDRVRGFVETYETTGCAQEEIRRPPSVYSPSETGRGGAGGTDPGIGVGPGSPSS